MESRNNRSTFASTGADPLCYNYLTPAADSPPPALSWDVRQILEQPASSLPKDWPPKFEVDSLTNLQDLQPLNEHGSCKIEVSRWSCLLEMTTDRYIINFQLVQSQSSPFTLEIKRSNLQANTSCCYSEGPFPNSGGPASLRFPSDWGSKELTNLPLTSEFK